MGEEGIRSKSRVPRNEEEEERAGGKRERKESTGGGESQEQYREKRGRGQARLKHPKQRERKRERGGDRGSQEDKGRVLIIKGAPAWQTENSFTHPTTKELPNTSANKNTNESIRPDNYTHH